MISLIICSRHSDISQSLKENIVETIGVESELIVIDNSSNNHSIFSAYNEGVRRAKYPYLCFAHEDILFRTQDWGWNVIKHFEDTTIGLVGMAGTHFLPKVPVYWTHSPFISEHNLTNDNGQVIECFKLDFFKDKDILDVVACDGFCLFIRKELFKTIFFDEKTFTGFHYYDMDICMQVLANNLRVCICNDVLIEHFWSDNYNKIGLKSFYLNQEVFFNKWKNYLPISRGINDIPSYVLDRLNGVFGDAYDAKKVRKSKAYKIGRFMLAPLKFLLRAKES
ncbi:MAG TPA: glycosyltransferase [Paludibacter sp.]|nr:glycosyltransferase [Paludibacter sp.]